MAKTPEFDLRENTFKNYLMNGDMRIAQRGTSFPAIAHGAYTLDRFVNIKTTGAVHTASQDTDVPSFAQSGYTFQNSLRYNLTTPDDTIAASDVHYIEQRIEGFNFTNIAQKTFTLSFWVKATLTGTYSVALRNSTPDRSYVAEYTIDTTNTWEYKTITVTGSPSAGAWNYSSGIGLRVAWILASGSTNNTTPGTWQTGNFTGTANIVNGVQTGATDFRITGVMLNVGAEAADFKLFSNGSLLEEIAVCQQYYEKSYDRDVAPGTVTNNGAVNFRANGTNHIQWCPTKVFHRLSPPSSVIFYNPGTLNLTGSWRDNSAATDKAVALSTSGQNGISVTVTASVDLNGMTGHYVIESEL